jgi:hypothetical protein
MGDVVEAPRANGWTEWRRAEIFVQQHDEDLVWAAIVDLDPTRITVINLCRVACVGFQRLADMVLFKVAHSELGEAVRCDEGNLTAWIEPCDEPAPIEEWLGEMIPDAEFGTFSVVVVDLADSGMLAAFRRACAVRLGPGHEQRVRVDLG